jgi:branched-chain amino acid transport system ATP-binding protein
MGHEDVAEITDLIKTVAQGRTVLLVEHNMKVVSRICDRISVLQRGAIIAEGTFAEVSADQRVAEAYIGSTVPERVLPEH